MFVLSMKTTRPRLAAFGAVFCVLLAVVLGTKALSRGTVPVTAPAAANPAAYLQSFGYEVEPQWTALQEITVPVEEDPAFAAYNAGPGNVSKWLGDSEYSDDGETLSYIPFKETRNYVTKVNKAIEIYDRLYYSE